jgi:hypothetical protein
MVGGVINGQRKGFPKLIDLIRAKTSIEVEDRANLLEIHDAPASWALALGRSRGERLGAERKEDAL